MEQEKSLSNTAFRVAEKKYQLHKDLDWRYRNGKQCGKGHVARATELSDVVNVHDVNADLNHQASKLHPVETPGFTGQAYTIVGCPGCVYFPSAVAHNEQVRITREAFEDYCDAPSTTNHTAAHGPLQGIWNAAQHNLVLKASRAHAQSPQHGSRSCLDCSLTDTTASNSIPDDSTHHSQSNSTHSEQETSPSTTSQVNNSSLYGSHWEAVVASHTGKSGHLLPSILTAQRILSKLRWASLGPPYDWTRRVYRRDSPSRPLPSFLRALALSMASQAANLLETSAENCAHGESSAPGSCIRGSKGSVSAYDPDAAIVNYYHEGDTLNGHQDDVERDLEQPIVSVSVGVDAVFLLGGITRDVAPTAILLRSGDVLVMSSSARLCFHGVPRIFTDGPLPADLEASISVEDEPYMVMLRKSRINLSIRHTHLPDGSNLVD